MTTTSRSTGGDTTRLPERHKRLLGEAAANDGVIHIGDWTDPADRKAADALVRNGLLSPGSGLHGSSARHITDHGWRVLAALTTPASTED